MAIIAIAVTVVSVMTTMSFRAFAQERGNENESVPIFVPSGEDVFRQEERIAVYLKEEYNAEGTSGFSFFIPGDVSTTTVPSIRFGNFPLNNVEAIPGVQLNISGVDILMEEQGGGDVFLFDYASNQPRPINPVAIDDDIGDPIFPTNATSTPP